MGFFNKVIGLSLSSLTAIWCSSVNAQSLSLEQFSISGDQSAEAQSDTRHDMEYVDRHIVFLLDVSGSVKPDERATMQRGIAEALAAEQNSFHFNGYNAYAITVVYFADQAKSLDTVFVHSRNEAIEAVSSALWDFDNSIPANSLIGVGTGTNMYDGLELVNAVYESEEDNGFISSSKSVVVLGDAIPEDQNMIYSQINHLAQRYGATVHALPIVLNITEKQASQNAIVQFFISNVATPEGSLHYDEDGGVYRVRQGETMPVIQYENISYVVGRALDLNGF